MITFTKVRYKNILSTGNIFTEITLNSHQNTLIVGENGAGKSTLMDALTFALFGKPYRNINKPQMVNSINGKEMLVELEFTSGSKQYLVRRGIKPNLFEIHVDGVLQNQDARAKDYQEQLERFILKMNYKSFTQIVILGAASFVPFMQLSAADRRSVIEDLLDIQIFSNMNVVVKDKLSVIKTQLNEYKIRLEAIKEKIELHKKHIEELNRNNKEMVKAKQAEIANSKITIIDLERDKADLQNKIDGLLIVIADESATRAKHGTLNTLETKIESNLKNVSKEVDFFTKNDNCPTCHQEITSEFKEQRIHSCNEKVSGLNNGLEKLSKEKDSLVERLAQIAKVNGIILDFNKEIVNTNSSIVHTKKYIGLLEKEVETLTINTAIGKETKDQSTGLVEELTNYIEKRRLASEERTYLEVAAQLLKDGGIKTKIIKQYLPVINKLANKYLVAMDFFVNFTIDEEFKEQIKSRHRDDFSYQNFSEGEKQRIDLALLLTWRSVARLKNSVHTNLLILDETFDSSLDTKGTDALLDILHQMSDNTNIFVISHKDQLHDKFDHMLKFEKKGNFSRLV